MTRIIPSHEAASAYVRDMMARAASDYPLCRIDRVESDPDGLPALNVFIEYAMRADASNTYQGKWSVWYEADASDNLRLYGEW
jgi:hypothetical protein